MSGPLEIKVCIIGDTDVGKTSISNRYCHGEFTENSTPTIGASFLQKRVMEGSLEISLQIWDTAGQERFRSMAPMYYRGARAAVCVFDVTNEESFNRILAWHRDLRAHADPNAVVFIAGNKCDKSCAVNLQACEELAASLGAKFFRTSALTGEGIDVLFSSLVKRLSEVYKSKAVANNAEMLKLGEIANKNNSQDGCC